jgi:hypothetical protein
MNTGTMAVVTSAICAVILFVWYVIAGFQGGSNEVAIWLRNVRTGASIFQASVTGLALIVGGLFAYYRFFKEETYTARLQPSVTTAVSHFESRYLIIITVTVENTGQVTVDLDEDRTYVLVDTRKAGDPDWTEYGVQEVFFDQDAVQPGEALSDQIWIEIPDSGEAAFRADLVVAIAKADESEEDVAGWGTRDIVNLLDIKGNISSVSDGEGESEG